MANWQRRLELQPEWGMAQDDEITVHRLATVIAERLSALRPFGDERLDEERDELVWLFEDFSKSADLDKGDFDGIMEQLYDWADTALDNGWPRKKVCWVNTLKSAGGTGKQRAA